MAWVSGSVSGSLLYCGAENDTGKMASQRVIRTPLQEVPVESLSRRPSRVPIHLTLVWFLCMKS